MFTGTDNRRGCPGGAVHVTTLISIKTVSHQKSSTRFTTRMKWFSLAGNLPLSGSGAGVARGISCVGTTTRTLRVTSPTGFRTG